MTYCNHEQRHNNFYPSKLSAGIFRHFKVELLTQIPTWNDEKYIDSKGIPPAPGQGEYPSYLCSFRYFKVELLTQIPAWNN